VQEATVQLAEAKLARMLIKAPFNGMVGLRNVSVGDYVKEGPGPDQY
jgi:membrane fusion protein (multidrug efflux system)